MEALLLILGGILLIAYNAFAWGFILYKFWNWFVLPIFVDLPHISIVQAIGLMCVVNLFHSRYNGENIKKEYKDVTISVTSLVLPWASLFLGWLIKIIFL